MNGCELCENSDQQKLPLKLMKSGERNTNLSMYTMAPKNKGEESVSKKEARRYNSVLE